MLLEEKKKISEVSKFSILPYTQNGKLGNLGKCSFTSNFDCCYNLRFRNDKNELRQELQITKWIKKKKKKTFEVSEFSVLLYTQNRKLRNLRKCSFTSNFYRDSEALFFLWLLILSHIFPENFVKVSKVVKKIWRFSRSILVFSSILWVFWHFLVNKVVVVTKEVLQPPCCYKEIMTSAYNRWCWFFFYFHPTLNRLFDNCKSYVNIR